MRSENRNSNRRRSDFQIIIAENFSSLVDHFHFFFGVIVVEKNIYLRNQIKSDLIMHRLRCTRKNFRSWNFSFINISNLITKLDHSFTTCAADCLISRNDDAFDFRDIVHRFQSHNHDNRRAVWIRDNSMMFRNVLRIHFRNYQRHIFIHSKRR